MKLYWVKSPRWLRHLYPDYIWHYNPSSKVIYLTFDDGPMTNTTDFILDCLREYNAKATFFCIGNNAQKHPELMLKIKNEQHSIGNHTQHHLNGWRTDNDNYIKDCIIAEKTLAPYTDKNLKLFRPPYGKCTKKQRKILKTNGYKLLMWSVLSADFDANITKEECLKNIIKNTSRGSIIILHDSLKSADKIKYVLPKILKHFSNLGYQFKRVDSLTQ